MQMDSRARLGLHQEMIGAGVSEGGEIALRLDDHQMNVEGLCGRAADRLQDDRADGDVRNETVLIALELVELRLLRRHKELEHESTAALVGEIIGQTLQSSRLSFV